MSKEMIFGSLTNKSINQLQQLVDDSILLVRDGNVSTKSVPCLATVSRNQESASGLRSPAAPAAAAAAAPMAAAVAAVSAADHPIDFGDEHPMPADDIGL
jgi:hypothetical protein